MTEHGTRADIETRQTRKGYTTMMVAETLDSVLEGIAHIARYYHEGNPHLLDRPLSSDAHLAQIDARVWELCEALTRQTADRQRAARRLDDRAALVRDAWDTRNARS